jgi:hypothetical protein
MKTPQSDGLHAPWFWCGRCQRASILGTQRLIHFTTDALHRHPATLKLCPYSDCSANVDRNGWRWVTIQAEHPEYPIVPERGIVYER